MSAHILFFYNNREFERFSYEHPDLIENRIRYWLGKRHGRLHDIESIFVLPDTSHDYVHLVEEMQKEEREYAERLHQQEERATYERLKKKFEG